jgi:pimeloyl-ACP methyl ester carboxylesterase
VQGQLLLIHGLGGGTWSWETFQRECSQLRVGSFAVELPRTGNNSFETYVRYAAAALRDFQAEHGPCVVVGHSLGGLVAQKLAETETAAGFVFLASAPPWSLLRTAYRPLWQRLLRHPWRHILGPMLGRTLLLDRGLQDALLNQRLTPAMRTVLYAHDRPDSGRASMQMAMGLIRVDPKRIQAPCLVVAGTDDRLIPLSEQRRLADYYECPLLAFEAGHMLMLEPGAATVVARGICDWLEQIQVVVVNPGVVNEAGRAGQRGDGDQSSGNGFGDRQQGVAVNRG